MAKKIKTSVGLRKLQQDPDETPAPLPKHGKTYGIRSENLEFEAQASALPEGHSTLTVTKKQRALSALRTLARGLRDEFRTSSDDAVKKAFNGYYNDGFTTPPDRVLQDIATIVRRTSPSTFSVHCLHGQFIAIYEDVRVDSLSELNPVIFIKVHEHDPA